MFLREAPSSNRHCSSNHFPISGWNIKAYKGNTMLPTPHFWNNLDLNADYLTGVWSMTEKVRKWFEAGACLSAASQSVFLYWGAQTGSANGAYETELAVKTADSSESAVKNQLPLDGRLFVLLAPHIFPHLTESGTWKPLCFDCTPMSLGKALTFHRQFTLQGPSSLSDSLKVYLAHLSEKSELLIISSKWYICWSQKQEKYQAFHNNDLFLPYEFLKVSMSFFSFHCRIRIYYHLSC